jgi:hypothetical protein
MHHLAIGIESPARHRAVARQRTGMCLQNITSHPHAPFSRNNVPHPHNNQSQKRKINTKYQTKNSISIQHCNAAAATRSYIAQSNHRNSAAQSSNTNRRKSIGCSVIANLHKTQHKSSAATPRAPRNSQQPPQKQQQCITWPWPFHPQHDTASMLDNAQECACKTSRHIPTPPSLATMYPIRTTTNHKNGKSTQNIKPKTASASNTATQQPQRGLT